MPAARLQAVIEILDGLDQQPAEQVVNDYLRQRRYIGSKEIGRASCRERV